MMDHHSVVKFTVLLKFSMLFQKGLLKWVRFYVNDNYYYFIVNDHSSFAAEYPVVIIT